MQIIPAPTTSSKPITMRIFNMIELLFIHGILGKPEYFNFLQPYVPEGFHTTAILLDGHGKGPREFAGSSMEQWRRQVAEVVPTRVYLSTHDEMVSPRSYRKFPLRPEINVTMLSSSGHYYYADNDCSIIVSDFYKFLKQVSN